MLDPSNSLYWSSYDLRTQVDSLEILSKSPLLVILIFNKISDPSLRRRKTCARSSAQCPDLDRRLLNLHHLVRFLVALLVALLVEFIFAQRGFSISNSRSQ